MNNLWKAAAPICSAIVILGGLWAMNGCSERNQRFKEECIRAGGSVVSTSQDTMCLQGVAATRNKP